MRSGLCRVVCVVVAFVASACAVAQDARNEFLLVPGHDGELYSDFGSVLSINDRYVLVGAPKDKTVSFAGGAAYLYDARTGEELAQLLSTAGESGGGAFGLAVVLTDNDLAIVGGWRVTHGTRYTEKIFVFDVTDPRDPQLACTITSPYPDVGTGFGRTLGFSGSTLAAGAMYDNETGDEAGAVHLYDLSLPSEPTYIGRVTRESPGLPEHLGERLAIDGGVLVAGRVGKAFVFDITDPSRPVERFQLVASDASYAEKFGSSVAVGGGVIACGAPEKDLENPEAGAVYLFDAATGEQIARLTQADNSATRDQFGAAVDIDWPVLAVGAPFNRDQDRRSGSIYGYDISDANDPTLFAKFTPDRQNPVRPLEFGQAIGVHLPLMATSSPNNSALEYDPVGAMLVLYAEIGGCVRADVASPMGVLNNVDINTFVAAMILRLPAGDIDGDGAWTATDINAFVSAFVRGCSYTDPPPPGGDG